ncbi:aspartate carbamoyltransferase [Candidatus Fukatsuia anoeciicola]|uniref:aspartate carbamoyltransferase n=1 Tax=Candidatus Fukatsuia anoeciicola TaxID=2994492 RepID=UPI003464E018
MINPLYHKNIISIQDLSRAELELIIYVAEELKNKPQPNLLKHNIIANCFFEASTRTRLSFETAIYRLGGSVLSFPSNNTSLDKGETIIDTLRIICTYVDAIVIRHPQEGSAHLVIEYSNGIPIINAGDGSNQHPTQTLLDLFTIKETQARLDNLDIAIVGDLKYSRAVHSLTQALAKFCNNRLFFVATETLVMPNNILKMLDEKGITYSLHTHLREILPQLDILYITRIQQERLSKLEHANVKIPFMLQASDLITVRHNFKILHPLPRMGEISINVDKTPYAYYFQQAGNGIFVRQAILALVLNTN